MLSRVTRTASSRLPRVHKPVDSEVHIGQFSAIDVGAKVKWGRRRQNWEGGMFHSSTGPCLSDYLFANVKGTQYGPGVYENISSVREQSTTRPVTIRFKEARTAYLNQAVASQIGRIAFVL